MADVPMNGAPVALVCPGCGGVIVVTYRCLSLAISELWAHKSYHNRPVDIFATLERLDPMGINGALDMQHAGDCEYRRHKLTPAPHSATP